MHVFPKAQKTTFYRNHIQKRFLSDTIFCLKTRVRSSYNLVGLVKNKIWTENLNGKLFFPPRFPPVFFFPFYRKKTIAKKQIVRVQNNIVGNSPFSTPHSRQKWSDHSALVCFPFRPLIITCEVSTKDMYVYDMFRAHSRRESEFSFCFPSSM